MAAETQYTANTGMAVISTANSNLDGTGTLVTVLTAASNGTLVKTITIKATGNTTEGMVRLFLFDGSVTRLIQEIEVPPVTQAATTPAFEFVWNCDLKLKSGLVLRASTQNAETFNVIAEGLDWAYYTTAVRPESTNFTATTGLGLVDTANSNLNGTGTVVNILTAGTSAAGWKGCRIESINIKALVNTTTGMIRLFLHDGTNTRIIKEVFIPSVTRSGTEPSFETRFNMGNFQLQAGWSVRASTQNAQAFAVTIEGNNWKYPA